MVYITGFLPPQYKQMSFDDLLFSPADYRADCINENRANTRTYEVERPSEKCLKKVDVVKLTMLLADFNKRTEYLRARQRRELYREFYIPKNSGGFRKIDAPNAELKAALRELKAIFEDKFHALYHTSAFAYIRNRSTVDAVKRHQENESKWFAKFDFSNFFGSTTLDFVMRMFSTVFPFSEICRYEAGKSELSKALELAFLDGGLPQGTPISPLITNVMMIPIDFTIAKALRDFNGEHYIYTRYADDILVSSKYDFKYREVEDLIRSKLALFGAPFVMKPEKTRYGSSAGRNWNLGIMLNANNELSIGHKNKRRFEAALSSYAMDKKNGKSWDLHDVQVLEGQRNYYRMVEGENIDKIVSFISQKFGVDIPKMIKADLRT